MERSVVGFGPHNIAQVQETNDMEILDEERKLYGISKCLVVQSCMQPLWQGGRERSVRDRHNCHHG